jgi:Predicted CoA-binding protein
METIDNFLTEKKLAVAGVSRSGKKFGNSLVNELIKKGYTVFIIHPQADEIQGVKCYKTFGGMPERVGGVIVVVQPSETEKIVREAAAANIKKIWMQTGAESEEAIRYCGENGIEVVSKKCFLMYVEPVAGFHKFHRWVNKLTGKL